MAKLINWGLTDLMLRYTNTLILGEDVAEKGGVYNVTDNLKKRFKSKRVFNSPLDEQSILGSAIGLAHNNFIPIPEIQFLAYVHNAEDQIRGEAATLAFFSQGLYTNPMVIRVAGLAYQKGFGGHFHNDNSLSVFRDIPGLIIAVPSNGLDAVRMLRTCVKEAFERGRVCVFIEPIALYMTRDLHGENDKLWTFQYPELEEESPLGEISTYGEGSVAIVTYGNGTYLSLAAQKILKDQKNLSVQVIDIKWLAPFDVKPLIEKLKGKTHLLFVEECRQTGSFAEGVVSQLAIQDSISLKMNIHGASDCFIPLGPAATAGLPSIESIVFETLKLVGKNV
jgi:2-oxoisovalerate dehydrogenase E1 component